MLEKHEQEFCSRINPRDNFTSMMVAHNCRLVMGPGRKGQVYGIVALVPDGKTIDRIRIPGLITPDQMSEDPNAKQSWVSEGDLSKMLETFAAFPPWVTSIFKCVVSSFLWG